MHARIGLSPAVIAIKRTAVFVFSIDFIQEYEIKQLSISCRNAHHIVSQSKSHCFLVPITAFLSPETRVKVGTFYRTTGMYRTKYTAMHLFVHFHTSVSHIPL